jgi:hypothetical protein
MAKITKKALVAMANANDARMTGDMAEIWEIIDNHDIVVAVWRDAAAADGVGMMILKGETSLRWTASGLRPIGHRVSAISCNEAAQAQALATLIGQRDGDGVIIVDGTIIADGGHRQH